ncbi:DUF5684 domain-containing protein [Microbacterium rhizosphaerae]|uniref:DUF5684 domain-containing protein n=1 Tax=Microbacterium rhizosphaerae TaxID=1678237 RepID=UPI0032188822
MNDSAYTAAIVIDVLIAVAVYVWMALALSALFRKAGERGWKAWVPFLNIFVLLELGGLSGWNILLLLIPVVGEIAVFIILIVAYYRISRSFGYGGGMTVLAVLLPPIWLSVLGWGSARWLGGPHRGSLRTANADLDARLGGGMDAVAPAPVPSSGFTPAPASASPRLAPPAGTPTESAPAAASRPEFTPAPARPSFDPRPDVAPAPARASFDPRPDVAPAPARAADGLGTQFAPAPARPAPAHAVPAVEAPPSSPAPSSPAPSSPAPSSPAPAPSPARSAAPADPSAPVSAFAPRPPAPAAQAARRGFDDEFDDLDDEYYGDYSGGDDARIVGTTSAGAPAPGPRRAPISAVPDSPASAVARDSWAQPADGSGGAAEDTSGEVSAVVGAPALGGPMSARSSVSAQRKAPEVPDDGLSDETIVAPRRRPRWMLIPPLGAAIPLTSDVVVVGRRPVADARHPGAQLVPIADETRTMSKTHARLERRDDLWTVTDLASTNGVALVADDGAEIEIGESGTATIGERFLLGDAELRLTRTEP